MEKRWRSDGINRRSGMESGRITYYVRTYENHLYENQRDVKHLICIEIVIIFDIGSG
jgi:hypothetical protein